MYASMYANMLYNNIITRATWACQAMAQQVL